jgi:wyosine [tRNA(Phe)-imidazoG37] synthetase (radical SAM superfamily)
MAKVFLSVYGPVKSWRTGTSLGIDPIGEISTCSFNCAYCQLGQIQNITIERKIYVETNKIIKDLDNAYRQEKFTLAELDVITFAGSGEPTLALNLGEIIEAIRNWQREQDEFKTLAKLVPISILTNATLLNDSQLRYEASKADLISLKLDSATDKELKSLNQAAANITMSDILSGISKLKSETNSNLQLQIMFMPKFIKDESYLEGLAKNIKQTGIKHIQINTPNRPKPKSGKEYWLETRGNHYADNTNNKIQTEEHEYLELPVISKKEAFDIEHKLKMLIGNDLKVINVYKNESVSL